MKHVRSPNALRFGALVTLCACASVVATQTFELSTQYATMPALPAVPSGQSQTIALSASFGSCSKTALGSLDKLRANSHVDALDVWVTVRDIRLQSDATFEGIEHLGLELVTADETVSVCDRALSSDEQRSSSVTCPFEHRVRAEQLCSSADSSGSARMTIQLSLDAGAVTLTSIGANLTVETEVDADVSL